MKAFLQALVFVVFMPALFSCISSNEKSEDIKRKELLAAIEQAEQSEQIENELFLGFKFGMAEKEVDNHLKKLLKEGKLYLNNSKEYQYDYTSKYGIKNNVNFIPKFHEGKLYEMVYPIVNPLTPSKGDYIFMASDFISSDKGKQFKSIITEDIFGETVYTSIKGNLIIKFENSSGSKMRYTNAPVDRIVSDLNDQEREKKAEESSSEF